MNEHEIIVLLKKREDKGIEELLIHYKPLMQYIISPILPNAQDREDCISEVAMQVWKNIDKYNSEKGSWSTWLTAVTRNHALNCKRKAALHIGTEEIPTELPSPEPTPEEQAIQKERQETVKKALQSLPQKEQTLFYRKYYYMQSTAQIASETGMTQRAVEGKLYRIKKMLRKICGGEENE